MVLWDTNKTFLGRIIETSLGVSCKTCLRPLMDEPMWRRNYVSLRRTYQCDVLGTYPWDVVTTFLYDIVETYQWDVLATYHWDVIGCFIWDVLGTSLGRIERRRCDVDTTSPYRVGRCCFIMDISILLNSVYKHT